MNSKLILQLSVFGLTMGIAEVYVIPVKFELAFWLPIFLYSAFVIAKCAGGRNFLHGFLLGLANCIWITGAHVLLSERYLAGHPQEAALMQQGPLSSHPRVMMLIFGPVVGILSGVIIGLLALAAGKLVKTPSAPPSNATA